MARRIPRVSSGVLEAVAGPSPAVLEAISTLERETVEVDGGRLKLEWDTLRSRQGDDVEDVLWWEHDMLVGFVGRYAFGGGAVEVTGMVHPAFRRRGIGSRLLDEVMGLCARRDDGTVLLVAPRTSSGAQVMAERRGGVLDHSEHALDLYGEVVAVPSDPTVTLRRAMSSDGEDVGRILTDAFGHPWRPLDLEAPNEPTLVAERDGRIVATLRVYRSPDVWGVYGFAVDPDLQGRGIGRDLLARVCRRARDSGTPHVHLEVEVGNDRALNLYTSLGFTRTSTEDYFSLAT